MSQIKLGDEVRDAVTGFKGIAVSKVEYLTGCMQYGVSGGVDKEGRPTSTEYFDFQRLEPTGVTLVLPSRDGGGPQRDAPR